MITLQNGFPQGPNGLIVPLGSIKLQLNVDATIIAAPGGFVAAGIPVVFQFDKNGALIQPAKIWSNEELQPQLSSTLLGTYYLVTFMDQNGAVLNATPLWWQFPEIINSTVDISQMTPVSTVGGNVLFYPTSFGGSGTVTSVTFTGDGTVLSATPSAPVTTSGTIAATLLTQNALTFLAGPTTPGPAAAPTFRTVGASDISQAFIGINIVGPSFAAPTVTPAVLGSSTWGYTIVARQGTVNLAISAQGTTSTGTATLGTGGDQNVVTWAAVAGADHYDIFISTVPSGNVGYVTTVTGTSFTDTGAIAVVAGVAGFLTFDESGFASIQQGMHIGNGSWNDVWQIPVGSSFDLPAFTPSGQFNIIEIKTSKPAAHGSLPYSNEGFAAGNFIAYDKGATWNPTGINVLAVTTSGGGVSPTGGVFTAINNTPGTGSTVQFVEGLVVAGINNSPGTTVFVLGTYSTAQQFATLTGTIGTMAPFYADVFFGTKNNTKIGIFASYFAQMDNGSGSTNAGAAALTAGFYSADSLGAATDFSFYSVGGNNLFGAKRATDVSAFLNSTAATGGANQSSPLIKIGGQGWNGSATAADAWTIQDVLGAGTNPTSVLTFTHSGVGTSAGVSLQGTLSTGNIVCNQIDASGNIDANSAAATSISGNINSPFVKWNGAFWTGSVSTVDTWEMRSVLGTGNNPTTTLTLTQTGSSGAANVDLSAALSVRAATLVATAATPTGASGQVSFGTTAGFGAGSSGTAVTTTTKGGGTGPTTPQTVVNYLEIDIAGTKYWIPLVQ